MDNTPSIESYRDLKVWQRGVDLTERIYAVTQPFPVEERFGLVAQLRRAAVSIPSNIAEGLGTYVDRRLHSFSEHRSRIAY